MKTDLPTDERSGGTPDGGAAAALMLAVTCRELGGGFRAVATGKAGPDLSGVPDNAAGLVILEELGNWADDVRSASLAEIRRALRPGGLLRVATADLDALVHAYLFDWRDEPGVSRAARFNAWRRAATERFVYNEEDLRSLIEDAGFVDLRRFVAGSGSQRALWDLEPADAAILVLEARKPLEMP